MTIRPYVFWPLSVIGIPVVYSSAACGYRLLIDRNTGSPSVQNGLAAVLVICVGVGVAGLQFLVPADTGLIKRVAFALAYSGAIFVLTMIVTLLVLFLVFGPETTTF